MKLDSETACCQPTLPQKPNSKIVECNNTVNDTVALEPSEKLIKQIQSEVSCGLKDNDKDVDYLSSQVKRDGLWNVSEFDCSTSDDSTNANEDEVRHFVQPYSHSSQTALYQNDELPEVIACYREIDDGVIKDICIDQGVTSLGKILFGDGVDEFKGLEDDKVAKPSEKKDSSKDSANQCGSVNPVQIDPSYINVTETTEEKHVPESIKTEEHLETEDFEPELCGDLENGVNKQLVQTPNEEAVSKNSSSVSAVKESNGSSNKSIVTSAPASAVEESKNSPAISNDIAYDSKVEDGSITFNFDSSAPKEESSQNGDSANLATQNPDQIRHSPGESSFSVAGPVSGLITYSGPIAYSGSCSLRSDSSTTSTRSFAFPVLQAEWNSSPVRMRKAEKRKCKGWRDGLLCCRF